ncbi:MAG: hypothetical protein WC747_03670 [Candidatus Babeliales bacterium]|jgi:hypothetical protein
MKYQILFSMLLGSTLFGSEYYLVPQVAQLPNAEIILSVLKEKCDYNFQNLQSVYTTAADELAHKTCTESKISWVLHRHVARSCDMDIYWPILGNAATSIFKKALELEVEQQ